MTKPPKPKPADISQPSGGMIIGSFVARSYQPLPPDHPINQAIGQIISEWAQFEHVLDVIIWDLAGLDGYVGSCITAQMMGSHGRFKAIESLAAQRRLPKSIQERITRLKNVSTDVQEKRNRIIHDAWFQEVQTTSAAQYRSARTPKTTHGPAVVSDEEIAQTLSQIRQRVETIFEIRSDVWAALHASPGKSPKQDP